MTRDLLDVTRRYIHKDEPFGPTNADVLKSPEIAKIFFDVDNKIYKELSHRPTMLIGRRGSGKTAYLRSEYFTGQFDIILEIRTANAFARVLEEMEKHLRGSVFAESVAELWDTLFHILLFDAIVNERFKQSSLPITRDYLAKVGARRGKNIDDFLWNVLDIVADKSGTSTAGVLAHILRSIDNVSFDDAKSEIYTFLTTNRKKAVILIDSLDQFPIDTELVPHTIAGLLKCVAETNDPDAPFAIRLCLPTELIFSFIRIASNPLKEFSHSLRLQWHPKELLSIMAHRIKLYSELYETSLFERVRSLDPNRTHDARTIFESLFPREVINRRNQTEHTIAYLVRHTQLLPRQLLTILNHIGCQHLSKNSSLSPIDPSMVVQCVSKLEGLVVDEVFSAFREIHPEARRVCERSLAELPRTFNSGELQKVYTRFAKKAMVDGDFFDYRRLLIQIGAIGRVFGKTGKYINALFEYTLPNRLSVNSMDELCLHPLFSGLFTARRVPSSDDVLAVYPFGTEIETEDWRDLMGNL